MAARSVLETDGYKFSMAEVGWPLRTEIFYYCHRKGGPQILPVDVDKFVRGLLPAMTEDNARYLADHEYEMGIGFRTAIGQRRRLDVRAIPKGSVFYPREPVFSVTGPSALVSWLEPLVLQLQYRIQVATLARFDRDLFSKELRTVTCPQEVEIVRETLDAIGLPCPEIVADPEGYYKNVVEHAKRILSAASADRVFEVGLRSATCPEQHAIALQACREVGIKRTSNVFLAEKFSMTPVGTMGHEHVQRYGSDEAAFRAMRDRRPYRSSYLLDTYDTYLSGIPAALKLMEEEPGRRDSVRYDSGDKLAQYLYMVTQAKERGLSPVHIFEDELDAEKTAAFETTRIQVGVPEDAQVYGYGRALVSAPAFTSLTRDRVSAVYKLCQTGPYPTMKFANERGGGKESLPGRPVVFRRTSANGPIGIIAQEDETAPQGYVRLTGNDSPAGELWNQDYPMVELSSQTKALRHRLLEDLRGMKVGLI